MYSIIKLYADTLYSSIAIKICPSMTSRVIWELRREAKSTRLRQPLYSNNLGVVTRALMEFSVIKMYELYRLVTSCFV